MKSMTIGENLSRKIKEKLSTHLRMRNADLKLGSVKEYSILIG
jgi:hypothetical protein